MVLFPLKLHLVQETQVQNIVKKNHRIDAKSCLKKSEQCCLFLLKHRENWYLIFNFFAPDDV